MWEQESLSIFHARHSGSSNVSRGYLATALVGVKAATFQCKTPKSYDIERASQPQETRRVCADWESAPEKHYIYYPYCREIKLKDKQNAFRT